MEDDAGSKALFGAIILLHFLSFYVAQQLAATFKVPIASSADTGTDQEGDSILPKRLVSM